MVWGLLLATRALGRRPTPAWILLLAVEITSLVRDRMSAKAWRAVHMLSYFLFAAATIHMVTAGTDVRSVLATSAAVLLGIVVTFGSTALYLWRTEPRNPASRRSRVLRTATTTARQPSMPAPM